MKMDDNDFASEKKRRIEQFARALQPMSHRAAKVVKDCCFLRIEERLSDASAKPALQESKQLERAPALAISDSMDSSYESSHPENDFPYEGWRQDHRTKRYVQFVFLAKHFEIDLPRPTLWPTEAQQLLKYRIGFFFLGERPTAESASVIKRFHPLRKAYVHGDHHSAAEDIAYIFFDLWRFPVDSTLYLSSWSIKTSWDSGRPIS